MKEDNKLIRFFVLMSVILSVIFSILNFSLFIKFSMVIQYIVFFVMVIFIIYSLIMSTYIFAKKSKKSISLAIFSIILNILAGFFLFYISGIFGTDIGGLSVSLTYLVLFFVSIYHVFK